MDSCSNCEVKKYIKKQAEKEVQEELDKIKMLEHELWLQKFTESIRPMAEKTQEKLQALKNYKFTLPEYPRNWFDKLMGF